MHSTGRPLLQYGIVVSILLLGSSTAIAAPHHPLSDIYPMDVPLDLDGQPIEDETGTVTVNDQLNMTGSNIVDYVSDARDTAPATPVAGQMWFDTSQGTLKYYNGSSWIITASADSIASNLQEVLTEGNQAGSYDINMSGQQIINIGSDTTSFDQTGNLQMLVNSSAGFTEGTGQIIFPDDTSSETVTWRRESHVNRSLSIDRNGNDLFRIADTGNAYLNGTLTADGGAGTLELKPANQNHTYIEFFANSTDPDLRSAWIGFGNNGLTELDIRNELGDTIRLRGANVQIPGGNLDMRESGRITNLRPESAALEWNLDSTVNGQQWGAIEFHNTTGNNIRWERNANAKQAFKVTNLAGPTELFRTLDNGNVEIPNGNLDMNGNRIDNEANNIDGIFETFDQYDGNVNSRWSFGPRCSDQPLSCSISASTYYKGKALNISHNDEHDHDWDDIYTTFPKGMSGRVTVSFYYWETSANHQGGVRVENMQGQKIALAETENPQWCVGNNNGNHLVANCDGTAGDNYQHWVHVTVVLDTERNQFWATFDDTADASYKTYGPVSFGTSTEAIGTVKFGLCNYGRMDELTITQGDQVVRR